MRIHFYFLLLLALLFNNIAAQDSDPIVKPEVISSVNKFQAGGSQKIAIELTIRPPYHINAHEPSEPYLIPTTVSFAELPNVKIGEIEYPEPLLKQFAFSEKPLAVYQGTVRIFTSVNVGEAWSGEKLKLELTVGYQACDDHACLAPEELIFSKTFDIAGGDEQIVALNESVFERKPVSETIPDSENIQTSESSQFDEKGLLLTFVLVFLGGLALNLTPCVYPLIPITISYFGGQAEGKKRSLITHAVLYVLGMAVTYSILGMIAAFTGGLFGAALQNPYVLLGIAAVLVGLALSMFDLYEIRVPAILSNFAGGARQGYFGTLFMGLTVGIVAAPCIGPFVLALLTYVGEKGSLLLGFSLFFVLALGLGIPFLFLGIFSGSISKLPRSGGWMIWVRSIFGFILIAMAVYFLEPLFPNTLYYSFSLVFIFLLGGIYMAWIESTEVAGKVFPVIRNLVGIVFFVLSLFFAVSGIQDYLAVSANSLAIAAGSETKQNRISWKKYSEQNLSEALDSGKPVMLDFYADWCIPCKELDRFTFSEQEVVEKSRQFEMIKVDLTSSDDPVVKNLKEKFKVKGVPTLVFLTQNGAEIPNTRVVGFLKKEDFLPIMNRALDSSG